MRDVAVIGAGLFGATIAKSLANAGRSVMVLDDKRPLSGSGPSGCLMKPSWFSALGSKVYDPALETLVDAHGDIVDIVFTLRPSGVKTTVHWIPASRVTSFVTSGVEFLERKVTEIVGRVVTFKRPSVGGWGTPETHEFELVVVAAGYWCNELLHVPNLSGKQGVSFLGVGHLTENFIRPWAPYKQAVGYNLPGLQQFWTGDGTAILPKNWTAERQQKSLERMQGMVGTQPLVPKVGIRPYVKGAKPCLLEEFSPGVWLATGGAKNGMIAAGWAAHEIVRKTS